MDQKKEIIKLTNFDWNKSISICPEYNYLFSMLKEQYNIDSTILNNLIELDLFSEIANVHVSFNKGILTYTLNEQPKLIEDYKNSLPYIFACYPLFDNSFKIKNIKRDYLLSNENKECNIMLELCHVYSEYNIYIQLEFKEEFLIPYSTDLLNNKEKNNLNNELLKQKNILEYEYGLIQIQKVLYFEMKLDILYSKKDYEYINLEIKKEINKVHKEYIDKINKFKNENKIFFNRALLKLEVDNF